MAEPDVVVWVAGATGYTGRSVVARLAALGPDLWGFDRRQGARVEPIAAALRLDAGVRAAGRPSAPVSRPRTASASTSA